MDLVRTPDKKKDNRVKSSPHSVLSHRFRESPQKTTRRQTQERSSEDSIAVMVPAPSRRWEYQPYQGDTTVESILQEIEGPDGGIVYKVEYETGKIEDVSILSLFCRSSATLLVRDCLYILLKMQILCCLAMDGSYHSHRNIHCNEAERAVP